VVADLCIFYSKWCFVSAHALRSCLEFIALCGRHERNEVVCVGGSGMACVGGDNRGDTEEAERGSIVRSAAEWLLCANSGNDRLTFACIYI